MTAYALPTGWGISRMEMRIESNTRSFSSPYSPSSQQVVDLMGDYWRLSLDIVPGVSLSNGAAVEAFIARLAGPLNTITFYDRLRPHPLGTMRDGAAYSWTWTGGAFSWGAFSWTYGNPVLRYAVAQFATSATVSTIAGRTLKAGDKIGLPNGQTVMVLADATADSNGDMAIEFRPAARSAMAAYGAVTWDRPTIPFRLTGPVPVTWSPGLYEGFSLDLIEAT